MTRRHDASQDNPLRTVARIRASATNLHASGHEVFFSVWSGLLRGRRIRDESLELVDDAKLRLIRLGRGRHGRHPLVGSSHRVSTLLNGPRPCFESLHTPFELLDASQHLGDLKRWWRNHNLVVGSQAGPPDTRRSSDNGQHPQRTDSIHESHPFFSRSGNGSPKLTPADPRTEPSRDSVRRCRAGW